MDYEHEENELQPPMAALQPEDAEGLRNRIKAWSIVWDELKVRYNELHTRFIEAQRDQQVRLASMEARLRELEKRSPE
jgi:hypothetical protein